MGNRPNHARYEIFLPVKSSALENLRAESDTNGRSITDILEELVNRVYGGLTSRIDTLVMLPYMQHIMTQGAQVLQPASSLAPEPTPALEPKKEPEGFRAIQAALAADDDKGEPDWS